MIYSNQNVTINQGDNRLRVEFGDIKLEMSHQQAAEVARQILERFGPVAESITSPATRPTAEIEEMTES